MPEKGVRSAYSYAPFRISTHDLGGQIATGTAFHYLHNGSACGLVCTQSHQSDSGPALGIKEFQEVSIELDKPKLL